MFDDFGPDADAVVESTRPIAVGLGHNYVGTEHLLLALLRHEERAGDGPLRARGMTTDAVAREVRRRLDRYMTDAEALRAIGIDAAGIVRDAKASLGIDVRLTGVSPPTEMAFTPRVFKVLHLAIGIAATAPVTPAHVLQALLEEDGGLAVIVLDTLGVDLAELHTALASVHR